MSIKWTIKVTIKPKDLNLPKRELRSKLIKCEIHNPNSRIESKLHDHTKQSRNSPIE